MDDIVMIAEKSNEDNRQLIVQRESYKCYKFKNKENTICWESKEEHLRKVS